MEFFNLIYLNSLNLSNCRMMFHGSRVSNFVGILSRGLLLPKCVYNDEEINSELLRTDIGHLGYGIYFSDDIRTSLKYSLNSKCKRTRLIAVCEVSHGAGSIPLQTCPARDARLDGTQRMPLHLFCTKRMARNDRIESATRYWISPAADVSRTGK